uniref:SMYD family member 5 n=1 Tax=Nothobranchius korthausae TaxID=1143690 RepID=A0A1A8FWS2_9TELE
MFSLCEDPGKVASSVEVRFIDNLKGKGLFAKKSIKKGDTIFTERPLVSAQFLWNDLYKYKACEYCLRALETAEENARRLSGNPALSLPHAELCCVHPELHQACPQCQVRPHRVHKTAEPVFSMWVKDQSRVGRPAKLH